MAASTPPAAYNALMTPFDVTVRGGGAVGLAAALALARQGLAVALQTDARPAGGEDVRAYALNMRSVALLESLKVWDQLPPDASTPVYDMHVEGDDGAAALEFSAWQQGVAQLAWIVDAAALESTLREAARFSPHISEQAPDQEVAAALLVLAEGKASATRHRLGVQMPLVTYGQRAVAARLTASQPHAGMARQWFRSPDVLALLPFDRPLPRQSYGLVWSLPEQRAQELMAQPAAAFEQALMDATGGAAGALVLASERAGWPLFIARAERIHGPGWVLLGDAAHVVHPLAGQGLNLGLADVASLAQVIAARESWRGLGDEILLRRHARARELPTRAMGHITDGLLHLFASQQPALRELRNRGLGLVNRLTPLKRFLAAQALDA
jgi:2-polyprenyl-6-methoxyphenol hydroxylase-like FAD-dependent oxidoreductase